MIVASDVSCPAQTKQIDATVCWLSRRPVPGRTYWLRHTTREVKARSPASPWVDINALTQDPPTERLAMNDIAQLSLKLAQPIFRRQPQGLRATGASSHRQSTNNTVGAG